MFSFAVVFLPPDFFSESYMSLFTYEFYPHSNMFQKGNILHYETHKYIENVTIYVP